MFNWPKGQPSSVNIRWLAAFFAISYVRPAALFASARPPLRVKTRRGVAHPHRGGPNPPPPEPPPPPAAFGVALPRPQRPLPLLKMPSAKPKTFRIFNSFLFHFSRKKALRCCPMLIHHLRMQVLSKRQIVFMSCRTSRPFASFKGSCKDTRINLRHIQRRCGVVTPHRIYLFARKRPNLPFLYQIN